MIRRFLFTKKAIKTYVSPYISYFYKNNPNFFQIFKKLKKNQLFKVIYGKNENVKNTQKNEVFYGIFDLFWTFFNIFVINDQDLFKISPKNSKITFKNPLFETFLKIDKISKFLAINFFTLFINFDSWILNFLCIFCHFYRGKSC